MTQPRQTPVTSLAETQAPDAMVPLEGVVAPLAPEVTQQPVSPERAGRLAGLVRRIGERATATAGVIRGVAAATAVKAREVAPKVARTVVEEGPAAAAFLRDAGVPDALRRGSRTARRGGQVLQYSARAVERLARVHDDQMWAKRQRL